LTNLKCWLAIWRKEFGVETRGAFRSLRRLDGKPFVVIFSNNTTNVLKGVVTNDQFERHSEVKSIFGETLLEGLWGSAGCQNLIL
jgi:hypothetical protein